MTKNRFPKKAFTLVELLVVMAIISVLTSLCILGFKSLTGTKGLTGAGDQVGALLAFARQEAIAKDTMTALVIVTSPNTGKAAYRTLAVWEYNAATDGTTGTWTQASKWQTLPTGIVIDNTSSAATFLTSSSVTPSLPTLQYLGTTLTSPTTDYAMQVFLPSGRLIPPTGSNPYILQLVEGFYTGSTPTYQHPNATNSALPGNYVSYVFSTATGEPKIVRP